MLRKIEISASFTGKISIDNYENLAPYFSAKEIFEVEDMPTPMVDEIIKNRQSELQKICSDQFKLQAELAYQDKVEKSYQNIRFYDSGKDGIKYPSVTSCLGFDDNFFVSADDLQQAGEWKEPKSIPEIAYEVMVVS